MRDFRDPYSSRLALPADAEMIARHRTMMFRDMNGATQQESDELFAASLPWLEHLLGTGEYVGWLVLFEGKVVAGGDFIFGIRRPSQVVVAKGVEGTS